MKRRILSALVVWLGGIVAGAAAQAIPRDPFASSEDETVGEAIATDELTSRPIARTARANAMLSRSAASSRSAMSYTASMAQNYAGSAADYTGGCSDCASSGGSCASGSCGCGSSGCGPSGCGSAGCGGYGCSGSCGGTCGSRFWGRVEFLTWWSKGGHLPPLVSTSPQGTDDVDAGVLGPGFTNDDNASLLYGNQNVLTDERYGGRVHMGAFLDPGQCWMLGGDFFQLGDGEKEFNATSNGDPILARPFLNVDGGEFQDATLTAYPDVISGSISVRTDNDVLGAGAYVRRKVIGGCCNRLDFLAGYRFLRMDDSLIVTEDLVAGPDHGLVQQGSTFDIEDLFDVQNEFHGGEIGLVYELQRSRWNVSLLGRVAFGNNQQRVRINGSTAIFVPGPPEQNVLFERGLLAQQTNIGRYEESEFAVLPEASVTLGYQVTCNCRATLGYTFMYLSSVSRAGDQVDTSVNGQLLAGNFPVDPARPAFNLNDTDFWLQGINLGLEFRR